MTQVVYYVGWKFHLVLSHVKHKLFVQRIAFAHLGDVKEHRLADNTVGRKGDCSDGVNESGVMKYSQSKGYHLFPETNIAAEFRQSQQKGRGASS